MTRHPFFGIFLAAFGTLVLTPDALLMRLSEMSGLQMTAWRGLLMGSVFIVLWAVLSPNRRADLARMRSRAGLTIVVCQFFNSLLFCFAIAMAPVAVVLFGLAAVPVFAAIFAWLMLGEPTRGSTWLAIIAVMIGIGIAVSGSKDGGFGLDLKSLTGAVLGLGVAVVLALNFVVIRARPDVPIMLAIGCGALSVGAVSAILIGPVAMADGHIWAMATTGAIVLPISFFCLSLASRYTQASNVSLLMLLETVLGPYWVWLVIGETPTPRMILGGVIVIVSLAIYLMVTGRQMQRAGLSGH